MARRIITIQRLIAALGVAVLLLGALSLWLLLQGVRPIGNEPVSDRVRRQLAAHHPGMELQYLIVGRTPGVACGYAGMPVAPGLATRIGAPPPPPNIVAFVSRKNRIITNRDPMPLEFAEQTRRECPDFPIRVPTKSS